MGRIPRPPPSLRHRFSAFWLRSVSKCVLFTLLSAIFCKFFRLVSVSTVIAYWYPFEGLNSDNKTEIKKLGAHQSWLGMKVYTGSWVVRMVRDNSITHVSYLGSGVGFSPV